MEEKFKNLPLRIGVGIIVLNKENKVFVAKRIDNPKDFWQMPQGGVNEGEDFLTAAYRELAEETNKPIVFHNREADEDIINILSDFPNVIGVAHCFSGSYETAIKLIEMGFYISFSGNLTFKNSHLPEVAKKLPLDKLLVETDSPFLSPVPFRGKTNEPGRARYVVEKLAEIFDSDIDQIASMTTANAKNLFNLV